MYEFLLTCTAVTLATWSLVDLFIYSILFDPARSYVSHWEESPIAWQRIVGYGLKCPYCLSHWFATGILLLTWLLQPAFATGLTFWEAVLLIPISARLAELVRENVLPPLVAETAKPTDEEEGNHVS